jgi:VanZ family protein
MKMPVQFSSIFSRGLPLFLWMAVIFFFSSLHGNANQFEPTLLYYIERKGAHVLEYAVLMFLSERFVRASFPTQSFKKILLWAALFSILYAISDEMHQFFVPYRGAKVSDVLIDGVGVLFAGTFLWFFTTLWKRRK